MGSLFSPLLLLLTLFSSSSSSSPSQPITSPRMLDLMIRDYTTNLSSSTLKTGVPKTITLPSNLTGITATAIRLRCGSLHRYGAQLEEFHLPSKGSATALPCVERILLIRQSLAHNKSDIYYKSYNFRGYRAVSPILGLLAYNAQSTDPFELGVYASTRSPIKIDFSGAGISSKKHYCATFGSGGKMRLLNMVAPLVCVSERLGHFVLVAEAPVKGRVPVEGSGSGLEEGKASRWKMAVGSSIGAAIGAFLLGLLLIAMAVRAKQRTKVEEERVRRAYEEEALQVSMVGHVRAPVAGRTRTPPSIEHHYRPPRV